MRSEGYCTWFVSVSVLCLLPRFLQLRATRQRTSDANRFIATLHIEKGDFTVGAHVRLSASYVLAGDHE